MLGSTRSKAIGGKGQRAWIQVTSVHSQPQPQFTHALRRWSASAVPSQGCPPLLGLQGEEPCEASLGPGPFSQSGRGPLIESSASAGNSRVRGPQGEWDSKGGMFSRIMLLRLRQHRWLFFLFLFPNLLQIDTFNKRYTQNTHLFFIMNEVFLSVSGLILQTTFSEAALSSSRPAHPGNPHPLTSWPLPLLWSDLTVTSQETARFSF